MKEFITGIKEWLPSLAVIVTGSWLFFQWLFGERLRRQKEIPSLDGKLSATVISLSKDRLLITVEALWNNRSPFPVYLDIKKTRIAVFRIDPHVKMQNCALALLHDLGDPLCVDHFLAKVCKVDFFFEPNTSSTLLNHFILEPGIYGVRMELHSPFVGINWWKEIVLDTRHPASPQPSQV